MFGSWGYGVSGIFDTVQKQETRLSAASTFLSTGIQYTSIGGTSCNSSNECASGYFCNGNGVCQALNSGTSNGNSCGTNNTPDRGTCSDGNCTSSGCSPKADCCGPRYCRYSAGPNNTPTVYCACGYPPKKGTCTTFCSSYYASTGELNGGCTSEQVCDECSYCDDGMCVESNSYIPCHCEGQGNYSIPACYKCNENGVVVPAPETCSYCYQLYNFDCGCATINKTCCYTSAQIQEMSKNGIVPIEKCRQEAAASCLQICPPAPNKVCGVDEGECTSKTRTYGGKCNCTSWFSTESNRIEMKCPGTNTCDNGELARITGFIESPGTNVSTPWSQVTDNQVKEYTWTTPSVLSISTYRQAYVTYTRAVIGYPNPVYATDVYYQESRPGTTFNYTQNYAYNNATGYRIVPYVTINSSFGTSRPVDLPATYVQVRNSSGAWENLNVSNSAPTYYQTAGYPVSFSGYIQAYPTSITINGVAQPDPVLTVGSQCTVFYDCCNGDTSKQCKSDADCPVKQKCGTASAENCDGCYPDPYAQCTLPPIASYQRFGIQTKCPWSALTCSMACYCTVVCGVDILPGDPVYFTCPMFGNIYWNDGYYNPYRRILVYTGLNNTVCEYMGPDELIPNPVSDYRLKNNIREITDAMERVANLRPRNFISPTKEGLTMGGFVPEEVDGIASWAVIGDKGTLPDGSEAFRHVDDSRLVPLLAAALIEVYKEISNLKQQVVYLKSEEI